VTVIESTVVQFNPGSEGAPGMYVAMKAEEKIDDKRPMLCSMGPAPLKS
jgi:hypothetical protein